MVGGIHTCLLQETPGHEVYTEDPSSWLYIFCYPLYISCAVSFVIPLFIAPRVFRAYIPDEYAKLGKKQNTLHTLPGSTIHAIVVSLITCYLLITGGMGENRVFSKSPLGFIVLEISLGYFVGDFFFCISDSELRKDRGILAHHLFSIIGIFLCLYTQGKLMFFAIILLICELSTPFVNTFAMLSMFNKKESPLFVKVSLTMMAVFFACRIAPMYWLTKVLIVTLSSQECEIVSIYIRIWTFMTYFTFDLLNLFWFSKMLKGAFKYYFIKPAKSH